VPAPFLPTPDELPMNSERPCTFSEPLVLPTIVALASAGWHAAHGAACQHGAFKAAHQHTVASPSFVGAPAPQACRLFVGSRAHAREPEHYERRCFLWTMVTASTRSLKAEPGHSMLTSDRRERADKLPKAACSALPSASRTPPVLLAGNVSSSDR
jgi:hypothetical protein